MSEETMSDEREDFVDALFEKSELCSGECQDCCLKDSPMCPDNY